MKNNFKDSNKAGKFAAVATVVSILVLSNVTGAFGALGTFWRAASQTILTTGTLGSVYDYGYGYGSQTNGWGFGYGYGYSAIVPPASTGGGGGWALVAGGSGATVGANNIVATTGANNLPTVVDPTVGGTNGLGGSTAVTCSSKLTPGFATFSDISNSFAKSYIETLASAGIVNGYGDGTFRPLRNTTRAEFIKMILLASGSDYCSADTSILKFSDVNKSTWEARVIAQALELGYVDANNTVFRPTDSITRAEAIKLIIKVTGVDLSTTDSTTTSFKDVTVGWMIKYVNKALELDVVSANKNFRPMASISREETAKMVVKALIK